MIKSVVKIHKMDCPSEIKMIESLFENKNSITSITFDLSKKIATFFHEDDPSQLVNSLDKIGFDSKIVSSEESSDIPENCHPPEIEARTLKTLLAINFSMFLFEIVLGLISESTGILADSIDMLADAFVYGISLYAVRRSSTMKNKAAIFSGVFQIVLAFSCLFEVIRRFIFGSEPMSFFMISVASTALIANTVCLFLVYQHKDGGVHMKASWIFSANDVIVNIGIIFAGIMVYITNSRYPDLIIGGIIALIVLRGALQILKIAQLDKNQI